jgi:long-chain fatty acid transport protein
MKRFSSQIRTLAFVAALIWLAGWPGTAKAAGLLLYETGAPDLGTASAGRAAMAADASTAAANPAGMTLLDRSQLLGYIRRNASFD